MTAALKWNLISVEDYLAGELTSPIKHEYVGGVVHAMAGARNIHNLIATNIIVAAGRRLPDGGCRVYNSDTKLRVQVGDQLRFYYADVPIICEPNPPTDTFQDKPAVIFEVLSKSTRRIDMGEKKDAYLTIPSLQAYVLVEQDSALVILYRRTAAGFAREVHEGLCAAVGLPEIRIELPLSEMYAGVEFTPEPDAEDT